MIDQSQKYLATTYFCFALSASFVPDDRKCEILLKRSNQNGAPRLMAAIVNIHPVIILKMSITVND